MGVYKGTSDDTLAYVVPYVHTGAYVLGSSGKTLEPSIEEVCDYYHNRLLATRNNYYNSCITYR